MKCANKLGPFWVYEFAANVYLDLYLKHHTILMSTKSHDFAPILCYVARCGVMCDDVSPNFSMQFSRKYDTQIELGATNCNSE